MKDIDINLKDCDGNLIFVGDKLSAKNGDLYKILFGYYSASGSEGVAYGLYLLDMEHKTKHHIPRCGNDRRLKLKNESLFL